jgi:hypothetical protein
LPARRRPVRYRTLTQAQLQVTGWHHPCGTAAVMRLKVLLLLLTSSNTHVYQLQCCVVCHLLPEPVPAADTNATSATAAAAATQCVVPACGRFPSGYYCSRLAAAAAAAVTAPPLLDGASAPEDCGSVSQSNSAGRCLVNCSASTNATCGSAVWWARAACVVRGGRRLDSCCCLY